MRGWHSRETPEAPPVPAPFGRGRGTSKADHGAIARARAPIAIALQLLFVSPRLSHCNQSMPSASADDPDPQKTGAASPHGPVGLAAFAFGT